MWGHLPQVALAACHAACPHFPHPATSFQSPSPPTPQAVHFLCLCPEGTIPCLQVIFSLRVSAQGLLHLETFLASPSVILQTRSQHTSVRDQTANILSFMGHSNLLQASNPVLWNWPQCANEWVKWVAAIPYTLLAKTGSRPGVSHTPVYWPLLYDQSIECILSYIKCLPNWNESFICEWRLRLSILSCPMLIKHCQLLVNE